MNNAGPLSRLLSRSFLAIVLGGTLLALLPPATARALPWTMTSRTDYGVSGGPEWSTVADLNNDGHSDIVTANLFGDNVTVLLNNGDGTYAAGVNYPAGDGPYTVAAFDLNNDFRQDLVVANYFSGNVSVLMGNGSGTFPTKTDIAAGAGCAIAQFGWFNEDGNVDLVTSNYEDNTISVFFGDGAGGFNNRTNYAVGNGPNWVEVGDINADNIADFVTANFAGNGMSVLLGDGAGNFGGRMDYPMGLGPLVLNLADVDGDGDLDAAATSYEDDKLSIRLNDGSGNWGGVVQYATGDGPVTVDWGDLDIDGKVDLAVCNAGSASVSVFHGNGDGTFQPKFDLAVGSTPYAVSIGDVTNDGEPDLVSCNFGGNSISVLKGNVPGGFTVGDTLATLTAFDQSGTSRTLSSYSGKWMVVEICAVWCGPCQQMATEAQQVYDTWLQAGTVPFEYITMLVQGPTGASSTQSDAGAWADRFAISRPVLHSAGVANSAPVAWNEALKTHTFPTVLIVGPDGRIRCKFLGGLSGQEALTQVADLAGVPRPTFPGGPPPPPPGGWQPSKRWQALNATGASVWYGLDNWTGPLSNQSERENWNLSYLTGPIEIPGVEAGRVAVWARTDSLHGGFEMIQVEVYSDSLSPIATGQPWRVDLTDIVWPDGLPRGLAQWNQPAAYGLINGGLGYFKTPLQVQATLDGNDLTLTALPFGNVPDFSPSTYGFAIAGISVKHLYPALDVGAGGDPPLALALGPNPARSGTTVRWSMPRAGRAQLDIVDVTGRHVRSLMNGTAEAGAQASTWDLRADVGTRVAPGLYFVRLVADGQSSRTSRLVVLE